MLAMLNQLFEVSLELDGSLNRFTSETIQLQYAVSKQHKRRVYLRLLLRKF